jgi:U3 small nucleolar RNA-associated protein 11
MSSSMRNAIQRRNHKERPQPASRQKWGLLEKRKDYLQRAHDFKEKKIKKAALSALAKSRNPDEFYFAMTSSRTRDGGIRVADRPESKVLSHSEVQLLKTQDAGYIRVQADSERKKIESLEERLAFVGQNGGKHTVFAEDEKSAREFNAAKWLGTSEELVERRFNRPKLEQLAQGGFGEGLVGEDKKAQIKASRGRHQLYKQLKARMEREESLKKLALEQEEQRARMGKGAPKKGVKNKWATVRKR